MNVTADFAALAEFELVRDADIELYRQAGFGRSAGLGRTPALLVIDVQYRTTGRRRVPIEEAMLEYPTACGNRGWVAVDQITRLLPVARETGVPVLFAHVAAKTATTPGGFRRKTPSLASPEASAYDFVTEAAPVDGEALIAKDHPSAFFATSLTSHLVGLGIDTLVIVGATTSGCVRATAVDAFSLGFRVAVVSDGVFDRLDLVHQASLFDIASKYGDLVGTDQAIAYFERVGRAGRTGRTGQAGQIGQVTA